MTHYLPEYSIFHHHINRQKKREIFYHKKMKITTWHGSKIGRKNILAGKWEERSCIRTLDENKESRLRDWFNNALSWYFRNWWKSKYCFQSLRNLTLMHYQLIHKHCLSFLYDISPVLNNLSKQVFQFSVDLQILRVNDLQSHKFYCFPNFITNFQIWLEWLITINFSLHLPNSQFS